MSTTTVEPATRLPLRKERPPLEEREVPPFDWQALIDHSVHEVKVSIIEALAWIKQPLSANELYLILRPKQHSFGTVAYHLKALSDLGLIVATDERAARGARETYYLPA